MPTEILPSVITASAGLLGVGVGGFVTAHNQKRERRQRRVSEQLGGFYGPMVALRLQVLARSDLGLKVTEAEGSAWQAMVGHADAGTDEMRRIERVERLLTERFPEFEKITDYGNRQLEEFTIPLYRKMVELFTTNMPLAEAGTIKHYPALLEFVELWNRWLDKSVPIEVLGHLNHSEEKLFPFYDDLAENFSRMQWLLAERRHFWRRPKRTKISLRGSIIAVNPFANRKDGPSTTESR
jgi:hypothetical protein